MVTRATDPGKRMFQYRPGWGVAEAMWVICPRCSGPARDTGRRVVCIRCGFTHGEKAERPRRGRKLRLIRNNPRCRHCKGTIPETGPMARGLDRDAPLMAEIRCPMCRRTALYPAYVPGPPLARMPVTRWPVHLPPYLQRSFGRHTIFALNREHLDALETWLAAELRERGPVAGLTMMSRLPRWMKAAGARERVLKALGEMRAQAEREGLW